MDYDVDAVRAYHERRLLFARNGYDAYKNGEFIVSLAQPLFGRVLEVGTGRGLVTSYLAKEANIVSVDIDSEVQLFALELAKSEGIEGRIIFETRDIVKNPYPDDSFDIAVSANAFHHFNNPEDLLMAICRCTKSRIVIADFNEEGFKIVGSMHRNEGRGDHPTGFANINKAGDIMRKNGFRVERVEKLVTVAYVGERA